MRNKGDFDLSAVIYGKFTTYRPSTGAPFTLAGTPALSVYKDNSTTQSTAGVTLTVDFDSVTGMHHYAIDTSADGSFYSAGSFFEIVITTGTVDSVSAVGTVVGSFTLRKDSGLKPATAGRTLVVDAAGLADANMVKVGPTGSGTAQTARDIGGAVPAAAAGASGGLLISGSNTGTTTFGALTVTGATTLTGAVSLGSTLGVTGTTTLAALTTTGTVTMNALTVTNATTLTGAVSLGNNLTITGTVSAGVFTVTGTMTVNALTISTTFGVGTTTTFTGAVLATNASNDIRGIDIKSISGDATAADNAEAFFDGTGYAGTNNVIPTVTTVTNQLSSATIAAAVLTTQMTESYRSAGTAPTLAQAAFELIAGLLDHSISGTTKTIRSIAGTAAKTYTLDSSTAPTSITETT